MKASGPHVCPSCGERATMFAVACSICGAELDPHRADAPGFRRLLGRVRRIGGRKPAIARPGRLRLR
jgi:predicted amidophosphoribosyltransferase